MKAYRVNWKEGRPFIEVGDIVFVGNKRRQRRAKYRNDAKLHSDFYASISEAVSAEIIDCARSYSGGIYWRDKADAKALVNTITALWRLARTLQRHGVMGKLQE